MGEVTWLDSKWRPPRRFVLANEDRLSAGGGMFGVSKKDSSGMEGISCGVFGADDPLAVGLGK